MNSVLAAFLEPQVDILGGDRRAFDERGSQADNQEANAVAIEGSEQGSLSGA